MPKYGISKGQKRSGLSRRPRRSKYQADKLAAETLLSFGRCANFPDTGRGGFQVRNVNSPATITTTPSKTGSALDKSPRTTAAVGGLLSLSESQISHNCDNSTQQSPPGLYVMTPKHKKYVSPAKINTHTVLQDDCEEVQNLEIKNSEPPKTILQSESHEIPLVLVHSPKPRPKKEWIDLHIIQRPNKSPLHIFSRKKKLLWLETKSQKSRRILKNREKLFKKVNVEEIEIEKSEPFSDSDVLDFSKPLENDVPDSMECEDIHIQHIPAIVEPEIKKLYSEPPVEPPIKQKKYCRQLFRKCEIQESYEEDAALEGITELMDSSDSQKDKTLTPWRFDIFSERPPQEFRRLTGLTQQQFNVLFEFIGGYEVCTKLKYNYRKKTPKKLKLISMGPKDCLFLTLLRLKRGFTIEDLSLFFSISVSRVGDIFKVWIQLLYLQLKRMQTRMFTTRFDQPFSKLPPCFKPFKNYRATVDTTNVNIEVPYNYQQQGNTFSDYYGGNVIKYLIASNCWGAVSYVSDGYEGNISDRSLFMKSGICDYLQPNDLILVDRGFKITEEMDALQVKVVIPPSKGNRDCLSPEEAALTKLIAASRIHVERAIRKVKCFRILKVVTNRMLPSLDQIVYVICCLVNFDGRNV